MGAVREEIRAPHPEVRMKEVLVDLSDLNSVRTAAAEICDMVLQIGKEREIDVLFNNAGINTRPDS